MANSKRETAKQDELAGFRYDTYVSGEEEPRWQDCLYQYLPILILSKYQYGIYIQKLLDDSGTPYGFKLYMEVKQDEVPDKSKWSARDTFERVSINPDTWCRVQTFICCQKHCEGFDKVLDLAY